MKSIKQKLKHIYYITLLSLVFLVLGSLVYGVLSFLYPNEISQTLENLNFETIESKSEAFKAYLESYGSNISLGFIVFQVIQVVLAPIPGQFSGLLGGYVFGFGEGLLYTMTGLTIGSFIAMVLGRIFGMRILELLLPNKFLNKYDYLLEKEALQAFFVIFLLPYFPDDAICFVAGISRIKLWKLMLACILGRLPGMMVFSYMGANIYTNTSMALLVFVVIAVLSTLYWLFDSQINTAAKKAMGYKK